MPPVNVVPVALLTLVAVIVTGAAVTVLVTVATFTVVDEALDNATLPEYAFPTLVVAFKRIYTAVVGMVPPVPMVRLLVKLVLLILTSKPAGGVTNIPAIIFAPDTLNVLLVDAVPYVVLNADSVPVDDMDGMAAADVVKLTSAP